MLQNIVPPSLADQFFQSEFFYAYKFSQAKIVLKKK